ncbi:uncharacterized protein LOC109727526 [Ananas comosus]|uniref:Uncharacterized protein LOC109727526 n=1 Tax=Ananas comosus TaxID=4615 RepID=A0A6P5GX77_ANACO|nr:uncharacterized protein LOC109727526 [Ananas comosus]
MRISKRIDMFTLGKLKFQGFSEFSELRSASLPVRKIATSDDFFSVIAFRTSAVILLSTIPRYLSRIWIRLGFLSQGQVLITSKAWINSSNLHLTMHLKKT